MNTRKTGGSNQTLNRLVEMRDHSECYGLVIDGDFSFTIKSSFVIKRLLDHLNYYPMINKRINLYLSNLKAKQIYSNDDTLNHTFSFNGDYDVIKHRHPMSFIISQPEVETKLELEDTDILSLINSFIQKIKPTQNFLPYFPNKWVEYEEAKSINNVSVLCIDSFINSDKHDIEILKAVIKQNRDIGLLIIPAINQENFNVLEDYINIPTIIYKDLEGFFRATRLIKNFWTSSDYMLNVCAKLSRIRKGTVNCLTDISKDYKKLLPSKYNRRINYLDLSKIFRDSKRNK